MEGEKPREFLYTKKTDRNSLIFSHKENDPGGFIVQPPKKMMRIRNYNGNTGTTICIMTAQVASRLTKRHPAAKKTAKPREKKGEVMDALYAIEEHSLSGFLEEEPDLYTVADIKVRYQ